MSVCSACDASKSYQPSHVSPGHPGPNPGAKEAFDEALSQPNPSEFHDFIGEWSHSSYSSHLPGEGTSSNVRITRDAEGQFFVDIPGLQRSEAELNVAKDGTEYLTGDLNNGTNYSISLDPERGLTYDVNQDGQWSRNYHSEHVTDQTVAQSLIDAGLLDSVHIAVIDGQEQGFVNFGSESRPIGQNSLQDVIHLAFENNIPVRSE